jgi:hypothetical protein
MLTSDCFMHVEVWDKDKNTHDDLVGQGGLSLSAVMQNSMMGAVSQRV